MGPEILIAAAIALLLAFIAFKIFIASIKLMIKMAVLAALVIGGAAAYFLLLN